MRRSVHNRRVLTLRDPLVESLVADLGIEGDWLDDVRAFCTKLRRDRDRWDIQRRSGLFAPRRIGRDEAPRLLARALAALEPAQ